jgi:hypothetical protein
MIGNLTVFAYGSNFAVFGMVFERWEMDLLVKVLGKSIWL